MDGTLALNDGTILDHSWVVENTGNLFVYVMNGCDLLEVCGLFFDPEKTNRILATQNGVTTEKVGFSRLVAVRDEGNGLITAMLTR
jgi:hypothetical protein